MEPAAAPHVATATVMQRALSALHGVFPEIFLAAAARVSPHWGLRAGFVALSAFDVAPPRRVPTDMTMADFVCYECVFVVEFGSLSEVARMNSQVPRARLDACIRVRSISPVRHRRGGRDTVSGS